MWWHLRFKGPEEPRLAWGKLTISGLKAPVRPFKRGVQSRDPVGIGLISAPVQYPATQYKLGRDRASEGPAHSHVYS